MQKYLKSILFSLVALSALVLLAACGGGSTTTNSGSSSGTTPTTAATATTPATPTTGTTTTPATTATQSGNAQTVMIITDSSGSFAFSPATLTIKSGTPVTWKNMTTVGHTATIDDGKTFDSGTSNPIAPQTGTFSFTFTTPGTYAYHCEIHPFMKAKIIVQ